MSKSKRSSKKQPSNLQAVTQRLKPLVKKSWLHVFVLGLAMCVGGWTSIHMGQDINFDLLNYHYVNPHLFLNGRIEQDLGVAELQSYTNPVSDIPGYLLISQHRPRVAALGLGMIQGINIFLIFEIALLLLPRAKVRHRWRVATALFIGIISFYGAASLSELGGTMGDNLTSLFVFSALWLLLYSFGKPARFSPKTYRLAAYFVAGLGAGLKLTNLIYGIALLLAGLLMEGPWIHRIKQGIWHGLALFAGMVVSGGFWYAKLWSMFKNPIFPFYNGIFESPYYPAVNFVDARWLPKSLVYAVFAPYYYVRQQSLVSEIPFKDPRLAVAYTALLALIGYMVIRKWVLKKSVLPATWTRMHTALWIFIIVSFAIWVSKFTIYRYLLPIEMLAIVAIATVLYALIPRFGYATAALVVIAVVVTRLTVPIDWGRTHWQSTYFGVSHATFAHLENSTVLVAGKAPFGFLTPYFPESARTIRIESDLTAPSTGTEDMQKLMKRAVDERKAQNTPFYALRADEEIAVAEASFNAYGFKTANCQLIDEHSRRPYPSKLRICQLVTHE